MINPANVSQSLARVDRPARVLLALLLAVWVAWWLADTFWLVASGPDDPPTGAPLPVVSAGPARQDTALSEARIRGWSLFGPAGAAAVAASPAETAPDTRLRLELLGLFQHPDPAMAGAIIAEQGKEGELFRVGATVPGNASLEEILPDRVILLRAGQREALRLKEPELSGVDGGEAMNAPAARVGRLDRRAAMDRPAAPPPVTTDPANLGEDLSVQRNMIIQQMGLAPGDGEGYRIGPSAPAELLQQVGLRQGDVLVSVNGHTLGEEGSDIAALQEFRNTGAATIVVQRGAQRFTVNYPP